MNRNNNPARNWAPIKIKPLPLAKISAHLAEVTGNSNGSQFFVQLGEHTDALVLRVHTDEQHPVTLHEDFRLHLTLLAREPLDLDTLMGRPAVFLRFDGGRLVPLHGVVAGFQASRKVGDPAALDLVLASPLHLLQKQRHNRVFVDRNALDIAHELLRDALGHLCDVHRKATPPPAAAMITQYQETDYDFIRRILAREGLFIHLSQGEARTNLYLVNRLSDVPEAHHIFRLPYLTNSGAAKDRDHVSFLARHHELAPAAIHLKDYDPDTGYDLNIHGKHPTGGQAGATEHWGLNYATPDQGEQLARRLAAHHSGQSQLLELVTTSPGLLPGHILDISGHGQYDGSYRVVRLAFSGDQSSLNNSGGSSQEFRCRAWVLPLTVDYVPGLLSRGNLPLALSARITQEVDAQGCYRVRYPFDDPQQAGGGYSSPPTRLLQAFGSTDHGMHFPLARDSEVVIAGLNGDLDRPVILGAVFNHQAPDLVNHNNARSNLIVTRGGHTLRMEDQPDQQHLLLATPQHKNRLRLDATRNAHQAELVSEEGHVDILAGQNLLLQSGSSLFATVGEDQQIEIGGNETLLTEQGDIQITAGQDLILDAAQDIHWRTEQGSLAMTVAADMTLESGGQRFDEIRAGDYSLTVAQGNYLLQAAGDLVLVAEDGNLTLKNGGGLVQITAEGNLLLEAPEINLLSDNILAAGGALANN